MIGKLFRFWLAGLPAFLVAIPLNYVLVTFAHVAKPLAYMIVLFCQVTINFFACRMFVFLSAPGAPVWRQYTEFVIGIGLFRFLDWAVYVALVQFLGAGYLAVQILNVFVFSLLKYEFSDRVFQRDRSGVRFRLHRVPGPPRGTSMSPEKHLDAGGQTEGGSVLTR